MKTRESVKNLLELFGYQSLYPPQQQAISHGLLDGKNLLITTPTASGKTLIAIIASIKAFEEGKKVIYLTPLRALATEKYHDFGITKRLNGLASNINIKLASSDYSASSRRLEEADVLISTNEKMDSLIRRDTSWITNIGLFVVDEIHLIGEQDRGPTLEMLLAIIRKINPRAQILALSATVSNSKEIADWLGCELIDTNWRPTQLLEGIYDNGSVQMNDGNVIRIPKSSNASIEIAMDSIKKGGQSLIFASTRKRTHSLALKAAEGAYKFLSKTEKEKIVRTCRQLKTKGEDIELTANLLQVVSKGVAFHHAGLGTSTREIVEQAFKQGTVKLLVATPTLAAGVNLPARRVVISGILRYDSDSGANLPISILEYKQLCGRAGRPKYDNCGEAIIVAENGPSSTELYEHYILGEPEPIRSQLMNERALRTHTLSIISTIPGMKLEEIYSLFGSTLCGQQYMETTMKRKIDSTLSYLEAEDLIKSKHHRYIPTNFGRQSSLLYIDPLTAVEFKRAIGMIDPFKSISENVVKTHTLGFLQLISSCVDFYPKLPMRKSDYTLIGSYETQEDELFCEIGEYEYTRSLFALYEWVHEASDRNLNDRLSIEPGDMHRMVENAYWLAGALFQIARLLRRGDLLKELRDLQIRIKFGIKEELIPLVRLKGIGRARARALYDAGFLDLKRVADAPETTLSGVSKIGPTLAKRLKEQLKRELF
jgi:helicase